MILYWGEIEGYDLYNYGHYDHTENEYCGQTNSFSTSESVGIYGKCHFSPNRYEC